MTAQSPLFDIRNSGLKGRIDDEIALLTDADYNSHPYPYIINQLRSNRIDSQGNLHTESLFAQFETQIF